MAENDSPRDDTAAAAARVAVATAVSMGVQLGLLLGMTWAVRNRPLLEARARQLARAVRRDRVPADAGAQLAEHAADVARIAHAGGDLS